MTIENTIFPTEQEIPEEYKAKPVEQKQYLVNGELREWNGDSERVLSPVCMRNGETVEQKVLGSYPMLGEKEAVEALDAAVKAYDNGKGSWPTMSVEERIECVQGFVRRMVGVRKDVVNMLMWEIGKSYKDSCKEFDRTVEYVQDTVSALKDLNNQSSRFARDGGVLAQIRRAPLGTVLCMGPYNYPLNETYTTLIPALIMGNTVVFKPAKYGVLLHQPLLKAYQESFPAGVLNTIYGDGQKVIGPLMSSGQINALAFIGSTRVANILKKQHPKPNRLRSILGLGAKNVGIVLGDADLETAVSECVQGALSYNGQRCTALKLLYVQKDIAPEFTARFAEKVDKLVRGMPWSKDVAITPVPALSMVKYFRDLVEDAVSKGARLVNNGGESNMTFFSPAVLAGVTSSMRIYNEEQFGPVVPIATFEDIAEPLKFVDESEFGQQASIFGNDPKIIGRLVDPLVNQVCRVNVNSQCQRGPDSYPFTGRKDSAETTLSITDALRALSIRTMVAAKDTDQNRRILTDILGGNTSKFLTSDWIF